MENNRKETPTILVDFFGSGVAEVYLSFFSATLKNVNDCVYELERDSSTVVTIFDTYKITCAIVFGSDQPIVILDTLLPNYLPQYQMDNELRARRKVIFFLFFVMLWNT